MLCSCLAIILLYVTPCTPEVRGITTNIKPLFWASLWCETRHWYRYKASSKSLNLQSWSDCNKGSWIKYLIPYTFSIIKVHQWSSKNWKGGNLRWQYVFSLEINFFFCRVRWWKNPALVVSTFSSSQNNPHRYESREKPIMLRAYLPLCPKTLPDEGARAAIWELMKLYYMSAIR